MYLHLCATFLAGVLLSSWGCGENPQKPQMSEHLAGGWQGADAVEPGVKAAAESAVAQLAKQEKKSVVLAKVLSAKSQIVAGTNYELNLQVTVDGAAKTVTVVVWHKLDGSYDLTRSEWK